MIFETERLILRPWEDADAPACYAYAKDPRVGPAAGWPAHTSVEDSRQVIRDILSAPETYAIVWRETGQPIGSIGLFPHNGGQEGGDLELGFWVGVPYWGRGIVVEASRRLLRHAFEDLQQECVYCAYHAGNDKSKRAQEKIGFHHLRIEANVPVPQLGETRTSYINYITKQEWEDIQNG